MKEPNKKFQASYNRVVMKPPETIETSRLLLRLPRLGDAGAIYQGYAHDPDVIKYLSWRAHENIETTRDFLRRCDKAWEKRTAFPWVITHKGNRQLLGMIELRISAYKADLGYGLAREFWGQGYATEAVKAVVTWALAQPDIYRVWAVCDVENTGSAHVLEKAGMQREGILRRFTLHPNINEEPRDVFCYSIVKN
jgi:ribosomal-protein-alanine N-acetyltransferase